MKILLTSDTHLGITTRGQIKQMLRDAKKACPEPDYFVHAGDFSGNKQGAGAVMLTCQLIREFFPDTTFLAVLGNHDFWCGETPAMDEYYENLVKVEKAFHEFNVVWLSEKSGIWHSKDAIFFGVHGWYQHPTPPTNDKNFLPREALGPDFIHKKILRESELAISMQTLELLDLDERVNLPRIFISHFPIVFPAGYSHEDSKYSWSESMGALIRTYGVKHFINGHAHQRWEGQEGRYECGSDYGKPRYLIIEI